MAAERRNVWNAKWNLPLILPADVKKRFIVCIDPVANFVFDDDS
jgi:hypothetical protein